MRIAIAFLFALLVIAHQYPVAWAPEALVAGFLPAALAYHALLSLLVALLWLAVVLWAWPAEADETADSNNSPTQAGDAP